MKDSKQIIGMVHVAALPGTPCNKIGLAEIVSKALADACMLEKGGVDAVMIENMHDRPYLNREAGSEIIAGMTAVACAIKQKLSIPLGIQILAGANKAALAVALASGAGFIRSEGFVFGHLADEGMMNSDAGELLRYRKQIGAEHIRIYTDIKKKHSSHAISADVPLSETAKAAEFFLADGVVVTGNSTGEKASVKDLTTVKQAVKIPVLIGSGITKDNLPDYWDLADGFIVGSSLKLGGRWENDVDSESVKSFMKKVDKLQKSYR